MKNIILTAAIGLTITSNAWAEELTNSQKMEKLSFPEFSEGIPKGKSLKKPSSNANLSKEEIIASHTVADCIMARSYPKRSGGIRLHKNLHPEHNETYCRGK